MPEAKFVCTKCDDLTGRLHGPRRNTRYFYYGDIDLPMEWKLGYCPNCDKIGRLKEYVPSEAELSQRRVQLLVNYTKEVAGLFNFLARFFSSYARRRKKDYFKEIKELSLLEEFLDNRREDEFCYDCGSRNVVSLDFKSTLEYGQTMYYQGEQDIGFKHPGCGGDVILKAMDMRFMYAWPDKECFNDHGDRVDL